MSELVAEEVLKIIGEICEEYTGCVNCPFYEKFGDFCDHNNFGKRYEEVVGICKKWKADHAEIKTEWVHVCRIIDGTANFGRCVYEREIDEDEILPFDTYDRIAEEILKEYAEKHEGKFFAMVERLCRRAVK